MSNKRELVYIDDKSKKFWNIEQSGSSHTVTFGRIGTKGQSKTKEFSTVDEATASMDKLIASKLKKGYGDAEDLDEGAPEPVATASSEDTPEPSDFRLFFQHAKSPSYGDNAKTFYGVEVGDIKDFNPTDGLKPSKTYRVYSDWEKLKITDGLATLLDADGIDRTTALVIGSWSGDDSEAGPREVASILFERAAELPALRAMYFGDIVTEENEMSWIQNTDLGPLIARFPELVYFRAKGGNGLGVSGLKSDKLRALALETGGMDVSTLRHVCAAELPNLEYLELWLGTEEYGRNTSPADLQPILSGDHFPKLRYLGLRNCDYIDELAGILINSPVLQQVKHLDLSLGTLTDEGAEALLKLGEIETSITHLHLQHHFLSTEGGMAARLSALPFEVDVSDPMWEESDGGEWRFVAVGE